MTKKRSEPPESDGADFDTRSFVRGLAHEIANPLNAVAMNCELLRLLVDRGDVERMRVASAQLLAASARCTSMIRGLQSFGSALRRAQPETVSARGLVEVAQGELAKTSSKALPQLVIVGDARVQVDHAAIERAIGCLLRNAAEAGSDLVDVSIEASGATAVIGIRDNGEGFAIDHSDAPFYSTHRTSANHGLGLTLAREILRINGGSLAIVAAEKGAHVELRLPVGR